MHSMSISRSVAAETDLLEIWDAIASDNPRAADRIVRQIGDRITQLATFPRSGVERPDIAAGVRCLSVGNYLVLYQVAEFDVEIVRIVHGARDLTELFRY